MVDTSMLLLPQALEDAGVNVRVLDGWDTPHVRDSKPYVWREDDGDPAGHMHHHTATTEYTPNRLKANGYAGLSFDGSDRLYQEDYGDGIPVYTIANAYPAPISSGAGDYSVLERIRQGVEVVGRQGPDTPDWWGNTHYWNTEYVLNGIGFPLDVKVWDMMVTVCQVHNELMGWTQYMHIGHGHHTWRKPDLWDGRFADFDETMIELRKAIGAPMFTHFQVGNEYPEFEPVSWMLFILGGGVVDPNANSSQVGSVFGKTNVRLVTAEDLGRIADYTNMSATSRQNLLESGLYRYGKEIAALRQYAYIDR